MIDNWSKLFLKIVTYLINIINRYNPRLKKFFKREINDKYDSKMCICVSFETSCRRGAKDRHDTGTDWRELSARAL